MSEVPPYRGNKLLWGYDEEQDAELQVRVYLTECIYE
jgi:hypothetical protein